MIKLTAYQTTIILPNPQWNDSENPTVEIITKRSMNGLLYTYAKTKNQRRRLLMRFELTRQKAMELRAFINAYYRSEIQLVDHNNRTWIVNFTNNPFEFATSPAEWKNIQLEFEGVE